MRLYARYVPEKEARSREKALMLFGADMRRNSQCLNASAKKYPETAYGSGSFWRMFRSSDLNRITLKAKRVLQQHCDFLNSPCRLDRRFSLCQRG